MQKKSPTHFPRGHQEDLLHGKSGPTDIAQICWKRKCFTRPFTKILQLHRHWQLNNDWRSERRNLRRLSQRLYKTWYFFPFLLPNIFLFYSSSVPVLFLYKFQFQYFPVLVDFQNIWNAWSFFIVWNESEKVLPPLRWLAEKAFSY